MYIPKHTLMEDKDEIMNFIDRNSFAILVSTNNGIINATHVPVLLNRTEDKSGILYCHIAKANPQWKDINKEVLVIFPGPHCYISSSWYETDQSVPTWNYLAVHAYGNISLINERNEKIKIVKELVEFFEDKDSSYDLDNLKENYFDGLLKGIVAFKIEISRLEGKKKLSQNHSAERQRRVIKHLSGTDDYNSRIISEMMKNNPASSKDKSDTN